MKRILFTVLVFVLAMGVAIAFAGDGSGDKTATKDVKAAKAKSCCPSGMSKAGCGAKALSAEKAKAEGKADHACPEVKDGSALKNFHEAMHPMHMAVKESNFDLLREKLPTLVKTTKAVGDYKCDGYEKCSDPCRKNFDGQKGGLLESVDNLKEACKGKDNEKVAGAFDVMHEAYIAFANTCAHPEEKKAEDHSGMDHQ